VTRDRLALLVTSSALLVSWLSTPASPTPDAAAPQVPAVESRPPARDAATVLALDVARETERLEQRMVEAPGPRRSGRDPFAFGMAPRASRPDVPPPRPAGLAAGGEDGVPAALAVPAPQAGPALRLIGIAERRLAEGVQRSAILSGASDVYIVSEGDELIGRFVVGAIGEGAVELRDTVSEAQLRLVLPQ
jgi:hypothetical protein